MSLDRESFPSLEQLYEFLYKTAVCASRKERMRSDTEKSKGEIPAKRKRFNPPNQTFVSSTSQKCVACTVRRHPLYLCETFKHWPVSKRIESVKNAKLCYNYLRSHRGSQCKFSNCTICKKRHNTLLHDDKYTTKVKTDTFQSESART